MAGLIVVAIIVGCLVAAALAKRLMDAAASGIVNKSADAINKRRDADGVRRRM